MCQKNHSLTTFADRVKVFEYLWLEKDQFQSMYHLTKHTAWKVSKYRVFSGPYFPVFGLNTEIYGVNLRIHSEYRKIRTRKNSVFEHFSYSDFFPLFFFSPSLTWTLSKNEMKTDVIPFLTDFLFSKKIFHKRLSPRHKNEAWQKYVDPLDVTCNRGGKSHPINSTW